MKKLPAVGETTAIPVPTMLVVTAAMVPEVGMVWGGPPPFMILN